MRTMQMPDRVWMFNGEGARFPVAVFTSLGTAEAWIAKEKLTAFTSG
jgi:hypothetical protein